MKVVLIGGHLSPALALLDTFSSSDEVVFFGRKFAFANDTQPSLEYQTVTDLGIRFVSIRTGRVQRNLSFGSVREVTKIPVGFWQAYKELQKIKPDVVVGFGGYLSVPVCLAAKTLGIPVVIHEQTLEAGLANKVLSRFADKICVSWENSVQFFPKDKVVITGNPVKKFGSEKSTLILLEREKNLPLLYVTGGSTGAHALNVLVEESLTTLLEKYRVIHQTGEASEFDDFTRLSAMQARFPAQLQSRYHLEKFIPPLSVGDIMQQADLVVSRSGINTVTEILFFGVPALFIPLPVGQRNEQLKNAEFVKKIGLAEITQQRSTTAESLVQKIEQMLLNIHTYKAHKDEAKSFVIPNAAQKISEILSYVVKKTST